MSNGVDAAGNNHVTDKVSMTSPLTPLASNDLFDAVPAVGATSDIWFQAAASLFNAMNVQAADSKSTEPNSIRAFGAPSSITKAVR